jgi:hypothetical protein
VLTYATVPRVLALVMAVTALVVGLATPSHAHTSLAASSPAKGDVVETLERVRLEFTDPLIDLGAELALVDQQGGRVELVVEFTDPHVIEADAPAVSDGGYVLEWRAVAEDGHPLEGEIAFIVAASVAEPAPSPDAAPTSSPDAEESPAPSPAPSPSPSGFIDGEFGEDVGARLGPWGAVGIALAGAALVAIAWLTSRLVRRRADDEDDAPPHSR